MNQIFQLLKLDAKLEIHHLIHIKGQKRHYVIYQKFYYFEYNQMLYLLHGLLVIKFPNLDIHSDYNKFLKVKTYQCYNYHYIFLIP